MKSFTTEALWIEALSQQMIQLDQSRFKSLRYLMTDSRYLTKAEALKSSICSINWVEPELWKSNYEAATELISHFSEKWLGAYLGPSVLLVRPAGERELINEYYFYSSSSEFLNYLWSPINSMYWFRTQDLWADLWHLREWHFQLVP